MTGFEKFARTNAPAAISIPQEEIAQALTGQGFTPPSGRWYSAKALKPGAQYFCFFPDLLEDDPDDCVVKVDSRCRVTWSLEMVGNDQIRYVPCLEGVEVVSWSGGRHGQREMQEIAEERRKTFLGPFLASSLAERDIVAKTVACPESVLTVPYEIRLDGPTDPIDLLEERGRLSHYDDDYDDEDREETEKETFYVPSRLVFGSDLPALLDALSEREAAIMARIEALKAPVQEQAEAVRQWAKGVSPA